MAFGASKTRSKLTASSLIACIFGVAIISSPAFALQFWGNSDDQETNTQSNEVMTDDIVPVNTINGIQTNDVDVTDPSMGWVNLPPLVDYENDQENLSELDALSFSKSGVTFGMDIYDAKNDNPLVPVSVTLRALNKITAQYTDVELNIGDTGAFGSLEILPRTCDTRPPEEVPETTAFLEIIDTSTVVFATKTTADAAREKSKADLKKEAEIEAARRQRQEEELSELAGDLDEDASDDINIDLIRTEANNDKVDYVKPIPSEGAIFKGWMYASSPALNALEHPVYDIWVIACKMEEPEIDPTTDG